VKIPAASVAVQRRQLVDESFEATPLSESILVRFVISDITPTSCRFEQSFSDDDGKTWEVNWIATDARIKD
jgi:hypothetical protein